MLKEYQHHIADTHAEMEGKSLCGADIRGTFHFTGVDHAFQSTRSGSYLLPCPLCARLAIDILSEAFEEDG